MRYLLLLLTVFAVAPPAVAAESMVAVFADGSQASGEYVKYWYDHRQKPMLGDRWLFDPKNPVPTHGRWVKRT